MEKTLKITPLDPLFFRSPLPFTAGEQDWAPSSPLPLPGTLYGAIRSLILTKREFSQFLHGKGYQDIGTPTKKGTLAIKTYMLLRDAKDGSFDYLVPAPSNIAALNKEAEKASVKTLEPFLLPGVVFEPPKPQSINAFFYIKEDAEAIPKRWISLTGLKKYLNQESISSKDLTKPLQLYEPEPKSGIARNRKTKTSEIGKLYRVDHYRYRDGVSIITIISGTAENLNGIFTLGGERRTAIVREIETDPLENFALPQVNNRFLVYLMTPAIFRNGWYPERIISLLEKEGINLQLISAYIPNYIVISGWDIQKRAPKTLYRAVPEGSIYVFEVKKGNAQDAVKNFHGKNISDVNPEEGYGFALVGKI